MTLFLSNLDALKQELINAGLPVPHALEQQQPASSVCTLMSSPLRWGKDGRRTSVNPIYRLGYVEDDTGLTVVYGSMQGDWDANKKTFFVPRNARKTPCELKNNQAIEKEDPKIDLSQAFDGRHAYLDAKKIEYDLVSSLGMAILRINGVENLVVPLTDGFKEVLVGTDYKGALQKVYWDGYKFQKRKHGACAGTWYVLGNMIGATDIFVCEGVTTGLSIAQALQGVKPFSDICIICTCGAPQAKHTDTINHAIKMCSPNVRVWACGDNDWASKDNVGERNAEFVCDHIPQAIKAVCPTSGLELGGKPATDFNDLYIISKEAVANFFLELLPKPAPWDSIFGQNSGNTGRARIDKYASSSVNNKIDLSKFPAMLLDIIEIQGAHVRDKNFSPFVFAKIVQEMGLIGSQMYFENGSARVYAGIMAFFVGGSTSGKSYAIDTGRIAVELCDEEVVKKITEHRIKIAEIKRAIEASKKSIRMMPPKAKGIAGDLAMLKEDLIAEEARLSEIELTEAFFGVVRPFVSEFTIEAIRAKLATSRSVTIYAEEYRTVFSSLQRQLKGDSPTISLINIAGGEDVASITKNNGTFYCKNICASMAFASTEGSLSKCFTSDDFESGFMGRCLFSYVEGGSAVKFYIKSKKDEPSSVMHQRIRGCDAFRRMYKTYSCALGVALSKTLETGVLCPIGAGIEYTFDQEDDAEFVRIMRLFEDFLENELKSDSFGGDPSSFKARYGDFFIKLCMYFTFFEVSEFDLSGESGNPIRLTVNSAYAAASVLRHCINSAKISLPSIMRMTKVGKKIVDSDKTKMVREIIIERHKKNKKFSYDLLAIEISNGRLNGVSTSDLITCFDELVEQQFIRITRDDKNKRKRMYEICGGINV